MAEKRYPGDATASETAVIVATVVTPLEADEERWSDGESVDPWVLSAHLAVGRRRDLPRSCRRGGE